MKPLLLLAVLIATPLGFAQTKSDSPAPTLKSVMRNLGVAFNDLSSAILNEDYKLIEKAAHNIAHHPKPTGQLPTVIKTLGFRMIQFKNIDGKVHGSAVNIEELAKKRDMPGILRNHTTILNSCVACHTKFRSEISNAFLKQ